MLYFFTTILKPVFFRLQWMFCDERGWSLISTNVSDNFVSISGLPGADLLFSEVGNLQQEAINRLASSRFTCICGVCGVHSRYSRMVYTSLGRDWVSMMD